MSGPVDDPGEERFPVSASSVINELFFEPKKMIEESSEGEHSHERASTVGARNVHRYRVLVYNVINGMLKHVKFTIYTRNQNVAIQCNQNFVERPTYVRYTSPK